VAAARRRLGSGTGSISPSPPGDETVLLSFRVPASFRHRVHAAAGAAGARSVQAWLTETVGSAADAALTPHGSLAGDLAHNLATRLAAAIEDGSYADVAAATEDPDLR
jgi:hypothetical protein